VDIYVLDEPTLNLDALGIRRFRELVKKLKENGKTILFSSHILEDAVQLADRVAILIEGQLAKIESIPSFKLDIARETLVRIKLAAPLEQITDILVQAGVETVAGNGRTFTFKAEPKDRLSVIKAIETAGGIVEEFHTDLPNWETLLHQRFNNHNN
jgi:ABC-2 type transport system ATP-binding protein